MRIELAFIVILLQKLMHRRNAQKNIDLGDFWKLVWMDDGLALINWSI